MYGWRNNMDWECTNLVMVGFGATGGLVPVRSNRKKNDENYFY